MANFDFRTSPELPRPAVSVDQAARIARSRFGLDGAVVELGSHQDRNFRIGHGHVLKISNAVFTREELAAQDVAMARVVAGGVVAPQVVAGLDGAEQQEVEIGDETLICRVLTFLPGGQLNDRDAFTAPELAALGDVAGRTAVVLADFDHPGLERTTQWDARIGAEVVDVLLDHVMDPQRRAAVREATDRARAVLDRVRDQLPEQAIHGDITDDNTVLVPGSADLGVIDFGDVARGWRIAELATTCACVLHHNVDDPGAVAAVVAAFARHVEMSEAELTALWPLIVLRTAVLVVSGDHQAVLDGDNDYVEENLRAERAAFESAVRLDAAEMDVLLRWAARRATPAALPEYVASPLVDLAAARALDLSVFSDELDAGRWLETGIEDRLAAGDPAVARYGEYRLTRARLHAERPVPTLALGVEAWLPEGTTVTAPWDGEASADGALVLSAPGFDLWVDGLERAVEGTVRAGQVLGSVGAGSIRVQLSRLTGVRPPFFVTAAGASQWREICPDPSFLFDRPLAAGEPDAAGLLDRRRGAFAQVQEHYYAAPPQIERGWREHLVDVHAQTYLDMVNNVTQIGHAHPRLVEAVRSQWARLNTNSRFHYAELAEFSSRLADLAPDPLDTVFLVNSGSEAVDLAIRLAQVATGRSTMLAVREAYHGWTLGSDAVSTSIGDNPRAVESRPAWVRLLDAPNPHRGTHRGARAPQYLRDVAALMAQWDDEGVAPAGFIAEPVFGNAGGVLLPEGYLEGVYALVRERGGLCIADEVQVGYGRLGEFFWGHQQQGVVPDIITIAKAMGNGHPLGAVITTRDVADRFAVEGSMFSSAGGSPVSCRVGATVLDVMADERLQENAREVGAWLKSAIEALGEQFAAIGAVHGLGLYLGVELVGSTAEPATRAAARLCEELLREGCVVQPTGDFKNILKIKPPLCLTRESAGHFVTVLARCLARVDWTEGSS